VVLHRLRQDAQRSVAERLPLNCPVCGFRVDYVNIVQCGGTAERRYFRAESMKQLSSPKLPASAQEILAAIA
jgi:hypothetical protein